jgi:hypothetical protein
LEVSVRALPSILFLSLCVTVSGSVGSAEPTNDLDRVAGATDLLQLHPAGRRGPRQVETFRSDPAASGRTVIRGAALERVHWRRDEPAFAGDVPGSLLAEYDSSAPAGLLGFPLRHPLREQDTFHAAAVLVIHSEGFAADPDGFFQISWGLWNSRTTGLDRTGSPASFATNTFDLVEFDWFPNVSPFFGGPFVAPAVLGAADPGAPDFDALGAFANAVFVFDTEAGLPVDEPLLAVLEHRPAHDALVVSVHRIVGPDSALPVPSAVTLVDLAGLGLREYELDTIGLTLWNDGFGGPSPAVRATVEFHALMLFRGRLSHVEDLLRALR